jgi:general stress protein 26
MTGDLAELIRIIRDIRIALLTTVGDQGQFHTRPVQTLKVEADATLWFFTDWTSPKVAELHQDVRVSLGYADLAKNVYVAVCGEGSLIRDPQKAKELWSIEQRAYYPKGQTMSGSPFCGSLSYTPNIGSLQGERRISSPLFELPQQARQRE